jgi:hypothetical protein
MNFSTIDESFPAAFPGSMAAINCENVSETFDLPPLPTASAAAADGQ